MLVARLKIFAVTDITDGDPVCSFSYSHDLLGRPVRRIDAMPASAATNTIAYYAQSEVASTTLGGVGASYFYDPAGNRTTSVWDSAASVYTANGLNQYGTVTAGGATDTLSHDAWGNLTDTRPFSYFYAYDNRLLTVYTNRTSGARTMVSYDYDAMQRVYYRTVFPSGGASCGHRYHYGGRSLQLEDVSGNGPAATKRYVWGKDLSDTIEGAGGVGGLLATEVGGVWYFPLYDNNGNITDYVSEDGEVVASYEYDAFGRTIAQSGAMADEFPFRFSTKYYDAETKLYYYGERFYSPEMGRWLNRDPIEEEFQKNKLPQYFTFAYRDLALKNRQRLNEY